MASSAWGTQQAFKVPPPHNSLCLTRAKILHIPLTCQQLAIDLHQSQQGVFKASDKQRWSAISFLFRGFLGVLPSKYRPCLGSEIFQSPSSTINQFWTVFIQTVLRSPQPQHETNRPSLSVVYLWYFEEYCPWISQLYFSIMISNYWSTYCPWIYWHM